jgi:hypothetical protein
VGGKERERGERRAERGNQRMLHKKKGINAKNLNLILKRKLELCFFAYAKIDIHGAKR